MSNTSTEKKDTTDAQLKDLQTENKKLKDSLAKAEKDNSTINARVAKLEQFEGQAKSLQTENLLQKGRIDQLENDNANYKSKIEKLDGDLGSATNELELLRKQSETIAAPVTNGPIKKGKLLIHHGVMIAGTKYSKQEIAESKELQESLLETKSTAISQTK